MKNFRWKENQVVGIEIEDNIFIIAQLLISPYIVFFNSFHKAFPKTTTQLENLSVLMVKGVTSQYLNTSNIEKLDILPIQNFKPPREWIAMNPEAFKTTLWENTENELELILIGENGGKIVSRDITRKGFQVDCLVAKDALSEGVEKFQSIETKGLAVNPTFTERLKLCRLFNKNVDPEKELCFGFEPKIEYYRYFSYLKK